MIAAQAKLGLQQLGSSPHSPDMEAGPTRRSSRSRSQDRPLEAAVQILPRFRRLKRPPPTQAVQILPPPTSPPAQAQVAVQIPPAIRLHCPAGHRLVRFSASPCSIDQCGYGCKSKSAPPRPPAPPRPCHTQPCHSRAAAVPQPCPPAPPRPCHSRATAVSQPPTAVPQRPATYCQIHGSCLGLAVGACRRCRRSVCVNHGGAPWLCIACTSTAEASTPRRRASTPPEVPLRVTEARRSVRFYR